MIRAVIFDMDGLMYDIEPMVEKCWKNAAKHTRVTMTPQTLAALRTRSSEDREAYLKSIFGDRVDYKRLEKVMYRELHTWIGTHGLPQKPGLWELLIYLKRNGYKLAVQTTNSTDTANWYLAISGCGDFFDVVVAGHSIRHGKPEPDCYLKAVEQLEVSAEECLVLEDSPDGIVGAYRAGCPSVMIPDLDAPTSAMEGLPDAILPDLEQVISYLRSHPHLREHPLPQFRNIIFDLGGVVVEFDPRSYLRERFADKKLEEHLYQTVFGGKLWKDVDAGLVSRATAEERLMTRARKEGIAFEMQTVLDEWSRRLTTKEDTVALMRRLKELGYHLYYLSNISEDTFQLLSQREFMSLFDGGVASYEHHLLKPERDIYVKLLQRYELDPLRSIFFDDTRDNVLAAWNVRITGLHFHSAALAEKYLEGYQVL